MARTNISLPDELHEAAKRLGINVSEVTREALQALVEEREKLAAWDQLIVELEAEQPSTPKQMAEAEAWAKRVFARFDAAKGSGQGRGAA